ncbi:MAG: tetratricopeptide repeat protein [Deltaproteobacteria bacterium]|nr:tetratricopeptide repeat protein [Deltaproteobacteria bacterium]
MHRPHGAALLMKSAHVLIGFLIVLLYARTVPGGFVYDDEFTVRDNPAIRRLANWPYFFTEPATAVAHPLQQNMVYRPLATTFFALEYAAFGVDRPGRWHLVSIGLFLLVIGSMSSFSRRLLKRDDLILVAVAFAAFHPLMSETVSWVSAQPTLLCALCLLLGLAAYDLGTGVPGGVRRWWFAGSALLLAASMFFKEVGVVAPLVVAAHRVDGASPRYRYAVIGAVGAVAVAYVAIRTALTGAVAQSALYGDGFAKHLAAVASIVPRYLVRAALPVHLRVFDDWPDPGVLNTLVGAAFLIGVPIAAWRMRASRPSLSFALAFAWLTYLPSSNLIPTGMPSAERYFFLPMIGLCWAFAIVAEPLLRERSVNVAAPVIVAIGCLFAGLTFARTHIWSSPERFWENAVREQPRLALGHYQLGLYYSADADLTRAEEHYRRALDVDPDHAGALNNLGTTLARAERYDEAAEIFTRILSVDPANDPVIENLVRVRMQQGRFEEAAAIVADALRERPSERLKRLARGLLDASIAPGTREELSRLAS